MSENCLGKPTPRFPIEMVCITADDVCALAAWRVNHGCLMCQKQSTYCQSMQNFVTNILYLIRGFDKSFINQCRRRAIQGEGELLGHPCQQLCYSTHSVRTDVPRTLCKKFSWCRRRRWRKQITILYIKTQRLNRRCLRNDCLISSDKIGVSNLAQRSF